MSKATIVDATAWRNQHETEDDHLGPRRLTPRIIGTVELGGHTLVAVESTSNRRGVQWYESRPHPVTGTPQDVLLEEHEEPSYADLVREVTR